jgi:hypothetical protein
MVIHLLKTHIYVYIYLNYAFLLSYTFLIYVCAEGWLF